MTTEKAKERKVDDENAQEESFECVVKPDGTRRKLGKNHLKLMNEAKKVPNPYTEDNEDFNKVIHREYLLEKYAVHKTNRNIELEEVDSPQNIKNSLNLQSAKELLAMFASKKDN